MRKEIRYCVVICFLILVQACASVKINHQDTLKPNILDGAWIMHKCTCDNKDTAHPDVKSASTLIVNGNVMFKNKVARWRLFQLNKYCFYQEEASLSNITNDSFEVTTVSERTFSPTQEICSYDKSLTKRTWKILSYRPEEIIYESSGGCDVGPMICTYRRLDK